MEAAGQQHPATGSENEEGSFSVFLTSPDGKGAGVRIPGRRPISDDRDADQMDFREQPFELRILEAGLGEVCAGGQAGRGEGWGGAGVVGVGPGEVRACMWR